MNDATRPPVYLDHAATTPMLPEAVEAMAEQLRRTGNANSLHGSGRAGRRVVEESRERIAASLGARPGEVIFTSGGTEADNLAVKGMFWAGRARVGAGVRVLSTAIEHHAVLDPLDWLVQHEGARVDLLPVDELGRLRMDTLRESVEQAPDAVVLVTVMWANNEVGTVQPLEEVVAVARDHHIPVHTDAVQAVGSLPVDFGASGVDALTLTAHKLGGPYGVGALLLGRDVDLVPLLHGGGQERSVRSGTVDVPAIAGFATAVEIAVKRQSEHAERVAALRNNLEARILATVPDAHLNGDRADRLPGHAHISFPGCEGDSLLMLLDHKRIEVSTGSACSAGVPQPSHVLLAMGRDEAEARSSLRFSLGHTNTVADVEAVAEAIGPVVERARAAAR